MSVVINKHFLPIGCIITTQCNTTEVRMKQTLHPPTGLEVYLKPYSSSQQRGFTAAMFLQTDNAPRCSRQSAGSVTQGGPLAGV